MNNLHTTSQRQAAVNQYQVEIWNDYSQRTRSVARNRAARHIEIHGINATYYVWKNDPYGRATDIALDLIAAGHTTR